MISTAGESVMGLPLSSLAATPRWRSSKISRPTEAFFRHSTPIVAVGFSQTMVAILSAVETVTPKIQSTLEAAALCKMADRGQITGGIVDGPLAFDNAVSPEAARAKGIVSPVAGRADILVVPDLEAGNMLAKQLEYLADAETAGIVLGARVPIVLTSRSDSPLAHMASCALALLLAESKRKAKL